jgi:5-methylcytosine-specific restriction endonuclease McrA
MPRQSLKHLSNEALRQALKNKVANENVTTADVIAHIAEFDERKLYLPDAYPSMLRYCIGELGMSEDEAKKKIQVARAAQEFPALLDALAEGRVHLTGLRLLVPHLKPETVDELLAAATHKSMDDIERFLAARFPKAGVAASVTLVASTMPSLAVAEGAPGHLGEPQVVANPQSEGAARHPRGRVAPLSAEAFAVQFTRSREADERFRYLQDLLGHQVSRADIAEVYDRAVKELIKKMERVRFGACDKPRKGGGTSSDPRHIPAEVKRAVWQRDGGQCTYTSESGHRCEARGDVEFDHKIEVARGGESTVDDLQLRCRGHNQYTAEQTFGAGFMKAKREEAKAAAARRKAEREKAKAQRRAEREQRAEEARLLPHELEVIPYLRKLGCLESESRVAARACREMGEAPLEARVKRALSWFGARVGRTVKPATLARNPVESPAATGLESLHACP